MPSSEFLQGELVRQWVGNQLGSMFSVMKQTVGEYFKDCLEGNGQSDQCGAAVRTYAHLSLHDFLLKVRAKEPEAVYAFDFLCMIRRAPFNHLPVLAVLYDAAPAT